MQTADEIQIALLWVQITVGIIQAITTLFFIRSVKITQQQEQDAKEQIALGRKQMELMANQYRDSLRPLVVAAFKSEGSNGYELELRNEGLGPAVNVQCDPPIDFGGTVIGSKSAVVAFVPKNKTSEQLFTLTYKSLDSQSYATSFVQRYARVSVIDYRVLEDENEDVLKQLRDGFNAARKL